MMEFTVNILGNLAMLFVVSVIIASVILVLILLIMILKKRKKELIIFSLLWFKKELDRSKLIRTYVSMRFQAFRLLLSSLFPRIGLLLSAFTYSSELLLL